MGSNGSTLQVYLVPLFSSKSKKRFSGFTCIFDIQGQGEMTFPNNHDSDNFDQDNIDTQTRKESLLEEDSGCFYEFFLADSNFWQIRDIEDKPLTVQIYTVNQQFLKG